MRKQTTISAKHAQALHGDIRRRDEQIDRLQRDIQHQNDRLEESTHREEQLRVELDQLALKLQTMGEQVGAANLRELAAREVATTALHGMAAVAGSVQCGVSTTQIAVTLRSLERDGREQLKRASNGAHA